MARVERPTTAGLRREMLEETPGSQRRAWLSYRGISAPQSCSCWAFKPRAILNVSECSIATDQVVRCTIMAS